MSPSLFSTKLIKLSPGKLIFKCKYTWVLLSITDTKVDLLICSKRLSIIESVRRVNYVRGVPVALLVWIPLDSTIRITDTVVDSLNRAQCRRSNQMFCSGRNYLKKLICKVFICICVEIFFITCRLILWGYHPVLFTNHFCPRVAIWSF